MSTHLPPDEPASPPPDAGHDLSGDYHARRNAAAPGASRHRRIGNPGSPPSGPDWLMLLMAAAAVLLVVPTTVLGVQRISQYAEASGSAAAPRSVTSPSPSRPPERTSPTHSAQPTPEPALPQEILRHNPIYELAVPARCAKQRIPASQTAFRAQVRSLVECQNKAWSAALADSPVEFRRPDISFYSSSVKTACGRLDTDFPASYCTGDQTLYFSQAAYRQGRYYRLSVAHFVIHEYAHHVQRLAGIFQASSALDESRSQISRRLELQAHCMAHYGLTHSGFGFGDADRRTIEYQFGYTNDPKGHGSTAAERYWGHRGLDASTIGACDTWSAKASKVK